LKKDTEKFMEDADDLAEEYSEMMEDSDKWTK